MRWLEYDTIEFKFKTEKANFLLLIRKQSSTVMQPRGIVTVTTKEDNNEDSEISETIRRLITGIKNIHFFSFLNDFS